MSQSALRRLRVAPCGSDLSADPASGFVYPAFETLEVDASFKQYERNNLGSDHDSAAPVLGEKVAGIKFSQEARGFGGSPAGAGSGIAASDGENGLLLKSVFGTQSKDTGTVAATGSTTSTIYLASSALFTVGAFVGVVDPSTGLYHVRQIRSKGGTTLTLDRVLPFSPATGAVIYASATYTHAMSGHQHLWFDAEGYDPTPADGWRRYIRGALGKLALKGGDAGSRMTFEYDFSGIDWSDAGQGTSQGAPTYPANLPYSGAFLKSSRLWVGASSLDVAGIGYEPGGEIQPQPSVGTPSGVSRFAVTGRKQKLSFKISEADAEAAGLRAMWKASTALDVLIELVQGGPGNSFAIASPNCRIDGDGYKAVSVNGIDFREVTLSVSRAATTGFPSTAFGIL
jgi:hypothetical protein